MRYIFLKCAVFCSLMFFSLLSSGQRFSDNTRISFLIASPGAELYASFGHSGLRIIDTTRQLDMVFDFGVFNFDTPNFYVKFVQGKLPYLLAARNFENYWAEYSRSQQSVKEYIVQLEGAQKQQLLSLLAENYRPENRQYLYDFFYDNCATRLRDLIEQAAGDQLIKKELEEVNITLRDLLHASLVDKPWSAYGIDIILGLEADVKADLRKRMFLPEWLPRALANYQLQTPTQARPVLSAPIVLKKAEALKAPPFWVSPPFVMSVICLLLAGLFLGLKQPSYARGLDALLFIILGLSSLLLLFLWFGTDHIATKRNLNILWVNPLYLVLLFFIKKMSRPFPQILLTILICCNLIVLVGSAIWFPQYIHPAFLPILGLMVLRLFQLKGLQSQL